MIYIACQASPSRLLASTVADPPLNNSLLTDTSNVRYPYQAMRDQWAKRKVGRAAADVGEAVS